MSNNLSKYITVKYFAESECAKEPYQATEGSAGYELFAAETKFSFQNQPIQFH